MGFEAMKETVSLGKRRADRPRASNWVKISTAFGNPTVLPCSAPPRWACFRGIASCVRSCATRATLHRGSSKPGCRRSRVGPWRALLASAQGLRVVQRVALREKRGQQHAHVDVGFVQHEKHIAGSFRAAAMNDAR